MENVEDIYDLSPVQQGMLFHTLVSPASGVYFEQFDYTLDVDLNILSFKRAWQRLVERHPVLRTAFYWQELDRPLQVVYRQVELPWVQVDWRGMPLAEQQERLEDLLKADRSRGFDLQKAPLMRLALIRVAEQTFHFIWSFHHMLMDGWCVPLLFREVVAHYEAFCRGEDLHLSPPRPYRDYIAWLQQQDLSEAQVFWRGMLEAFSSPTPLVVDRATRESMDGVPGLPDAAEQDYDRQRVQLPAAVTSAIQSFAIRNRLTLNTLVQGAWALLLSRYGSVEDVVFGVTVSGRPTDLIGAESMIGLFINTLPMRVRVPPAAPVVSWLRGIQARQLEIRQYEYTPLVEIQGWSSVPRGTPLFESIVIFENYPIEPPVREQGGGPKIRETHSYERTSYPLVIMVVPGVELSLQIDYDRGRFDAITISRMLNHLQVLLEGIRANPERQIRDVPLLTERERQELLAEWNDTRRDYPQDLCIHELFEMQAEQIPDAIAVVSGHQHLTFGELNLRSNKLAHHLRKLGVSPETLVGICLERTVEMAVGVLGVLKAGGAYVPLDPTYPRDRLAFMLEDTRSSVLLTRKRLPEALSDDRTGTVCLDTEWERIARESGENPDSTAMVDNLAYVIYTSGSTGTPKGILTTHRAVVSRSVALAGKFKIRSDDRILQFASLSFDVSVEELFPSWLRGATVVLLTDKTLAPNWELDQLVEQQKLTVLNLPSSFWHEWVRERTEWEEQLPASLRTVIVGSEPVSPERFAEWQQLDTAHIHWVNAYGPTETTVSCVHYKAACPKDRGGCSDVPIGRPLANTQVYLLDTCLRPVPIGVPGELYIGGPGLARGYTGRPGLTANTFVPSPFGYEPGMRLYKTGDLARYLPDGNLEFLGRVDHQVKVRGFRIEPGEIEAVLGQHPAVRETVVMGRKDVLGNERLVAYLAADDGSQPAADSIRQFLRDRLPGYMVPSFFVFVDAFPQTPSGKLDRRALAAPDETALIEGENVAPRTPMEKKLAEIWTDVLGLTQVGIYDHFVKVGGHSLLATQVVSRVRRILQVELPLRSVFEMPTIADLAEYIETICWAAQGAHVRADASADDREVAEL